MRRAMKWVLWVGLGTALEAQALRNDLRLRELEQSLGQVDGISHLPTLSAFIRWVFQTDTKGGKVAFCLASGALMAWFVPHIVKGKETL